MEIRTCEEYVIGRLTDLEAELDYYKSKCDDLQEELDGIYEWLEDEECDCDPDGCNDCDPDGCEDCPLCEYEDLCPDAMYDLIFGRLVTHRETPDGHVYYVPCDFDEETDKILENIEYEFEDLLFGDEEDYEPLESEDVEAGNALLDYLTTLAKMAKND